MRKLLACLLLVVLPLGTSWAGVPVPCGGDSAIAETAASLPADVPAIDGEGGTGPDCCAGSLATEAPCGPDCEECQGLGAPVLATPAIAVAVTPACPGACTHAALLPAPLPRETLRPPAPAIA